MKLLGRSRRQQYRQKDKRRKRKVTNPGITMGLAGNKQVDSCLWHRAELSIIIGCIFCESTKCRRPPKWTNVCDHPAAPSKLTIKNDAIAAWVHRFVRPSSQVLSKGFSNHGKCRGFDMAGVDEMQDCGVTIVSDELRK